MNHSPFWSRDEDALLLRMDRDGKSAREITEALPGRSFQAVSRRRRYLDDKHRPKNHERPMASVAVRVEQLVATIERARKERRAKAYIRELRKGLIVLRARERGV